MKEKNSLLLKAVSIIYLPFSMVLLAASLYSWRTNSLFAAGSDGDVMIKMRALLLIICSLFGILCGILGLLSITRKKISLQCMAVGFFLLLMEITIFIISLLLQSFNLWGTLGILAALILNILYLTGVLKKS